MYSYKNESFNHYLSNLSPIQATDYSLWKTTKKITKPKKKIPTIRNSQGGWARSPQEIAKAFGSHFPEVFEPLPTTSQDL